MSICYFLQFELELFWRYFKHLNAFLTQCGYGVDIWKILDIVNEVVNSKIRALLEYWGFHIKSVDEKLYLLNGIAWDSFEFEKASHVSRYSFPNPRAFYARSYYASFWCELCNSSNYDTNWCPFMHAMRNLTLYHPWKILMLS